MERRLWRGVGREGAREGVLEKGYERKGVKEEAMESECGKREEKNWRW